MLEHLETMRHDRSRISHANGRPALRLLAKTTRGTRSPGYSRWQIILYIVGLTAAYLLVSRVAHYVDPTSGWLDIGIISLPLFAAWSCLLGYAVAGLLPVMLSIIGKKGGMKKWSPNLQATGSLLAYIGYIALLFALL